ncbi:trace amine-associated receptor 13c-like [Betta splendens]|uniref:Trace amine-associated receptor 13c-like n=1 Tax=Betta splendens TaxID=158456 RepID=A0A9W2XHV8_BETSP|nr:trace amine-associated receptor 13c-like [Betta splendens]
MEPLEDAGVCFPQLNASCRKTARPRSEAVLVCSLQSSVALLTVVLNLLVIISISHFRQRHTSLHGTNLSHHSSITEAALALFCPDSAVVSCWLFPVLVFMLVSCASRQLHTSTNLLVLSLAVVDLLVGLLQMPIEIILYRGCWLLSDFICALNFSLSYLLVSVSVGNLVLISVDRYVAVCEPMFYSTKVTVGRVQLCVCLCWFCSAVHSGWILRDFVKRQQHNRLEFCYGECVVAITYAQVAVDFMVTFLGPFVVISCLYVRVFVVAVSQARAVRSHLAALRRSEAVKPKKSELKAARTLGVVVLVFLLCSAPYYFFSVAAEVNSISGTSVSLWLLYFNSCLNPLIYTFFYPWFRKAIKHIFTLQILEPESCEANIL